jgi:hypothetical protein
MYEQRKGGGGWLVKNEIAIKFIRKKCVTIETIEWRTYKHENYIFSAGTREEI